MIDAEFVQKIAELAETQVITVDDKEYASKPIYNPPAPYEPLAKPLGVSTLSGLVSYCRSFVPAGMDHVLHVRSHCEVAVASKIQGVNREREVLIVATASIPSFKYGSWLPHSEFMVAIQAQFQDYGDRGKVAKVVGTIREEAAKTSVDDGVTQKVTASAGIALAQEVALPNPVILKPYRTFSEVDQPPSQFVLRVQAGNGLPNVALFEADGGKWKLEAIQNVREYLEAAKLGLTIVA